MLPMSKCMYMYMPVHVHAYRSVKPLYSELQIKVSLLVRCPDFGGNINTERGLGYGTAKAVLFMNVSLYQGVLNKGFSLY